MVGLALMSFSFEWRQHKMIAESLQVLFATSALGEFILKFPTNEFATIIVHAFIWTWVSVEPTFFKFSCNVIRHF